MSETPGTSGQPLDQRSRRSVPQSATMTKGHTAAAATPGSGTTTTPGGATAPVTGLRRGAFLGYRWALLAFLLAGAAQISLAGLGVFSLHDQGDAAFAPHRDLGFAMAGLALLILVLAVIARPGARAVTGSFALVL